MIIKHSAFYVLSKSLPAAVSLTLIALLTNFLSPEQYGYYSLTIVLVGLLNSVFFQWINIGLARLFPAVAKQEKRRILVTSLVSVFCISSLIFSICIVLELFSPNFINEGILLASGMMVIAQSWYDLNLKIANTDLNPKSYAKQLFTKALISLCITSSLVIIFDSYYIPLIALFIGMIASTLWQLNYWRKISFKDFDKSILKSMWSYGSPLTLTFIFVFVIDASDRFIISYYLDGEALGLYSAAYDFTQLTIGSILAVVHLAAFPVVMQTHKSRGLADTQIELKKAFTVVLTILLPVCIGLISTSTSISETVFDSEYSIALKELLPLLTIGLFLSCLRSFYFDYPFFLSGETRQQTVGISIAALFNVMANFILIPMAGIKGAAYATVLSFLVALIFSYFLGKKVFSMPKFPKRDILSVIFSTIAMFLCVNLVNMESPVIDLVLSVIIGSLVYFLGLISTNHLNVRNYMLESLNKRGRLN